LETPMLDRVTAWFAGVAMATAVIHTIAAAEAQHMSDEETVYWPKLRERMTAEEMGALYDRLVSGRTLGMAARLPSSAADRTCARGSRCCLELLGLLRIPLCEASIHHIPSDGGTWFVRLHLPLFRGSTLTFTSVGPVRIGGCAVDASYWGSRRPSTGRRGPGSLSRKGRKRSVGIVVS
jgi:hypothetical protein